MAKSAAYGAIRSDVLALVRAIPAGRVSSFTAIGNWLGVAPRHVASVLATLTEDEQDGVPWHRIVGVSGALGRERRDARGRTQASLLAAEGSVVMNARVVGFTSLVERIDSFGAVVAPLRRYRDL